MTREEAVWRIDQVAEEKLTELNLSWLSLKELPSEIVRCTNLTRLVLCGNQITSIPEAISQLSNLTELDIGYNEIPSIPEAISQLSNLTRLYLSNTQITSIPEFIGKLSNLTELDLSDNQITSIPEFIGKLSNLTQLNFSHNKITSIPEVIGQLSNLTEIDLRYNWITEIPEAIGSMENLKTLYLRGNPVSIHSQVLGYRYDDRGCGDLQTILDSYFHARNPALPELEAEHQKIESEGYFDVETLQPELEAEHQKIESEGYFDVETFQPELEAERQKIESEGYCDAGTLQDARRRITASIVQRQGQTEFRRKLLTAYGGRCPITDCDVESAIEAAHIVPYQGTQTNHPTNGLPLRADIHTLFDLHLLSIRPDTNAVVIAPELVGTCYQYLADRKLTLPQDKKTAPNQNALSKHYETFLSKCKSGQLPAR